MFVLFTILFTKTIYRLSNLGSSKFLCDAFCDLRKCPLVIFFNWTQLFTRILTFLMEYTHLLWIIWTPQMSYCPVYQKKVKHFSPGTILSPIYLLVIMEIQFAFFFKNNAYFAEWPSSSTLLRSCCTYSVGVIIEIVVLAFELLITS